MSCLSGTISNYNRLSIAVQLMLQFAQVGVFFSECSDRLNCIDKRSRSVGKEKVSMMTKGERNWNSSGNVCVYYSLRL